MAEDLHQRHMGVVNTFVKGGREGVNDLPDVDRRLGVKMVPQVGFEPTARCLEGIGVLVFTNICILKKVPFLEG